MNPAQGRMKESRIGGLNDRNQYIESSFDDVKPFLWQLLGAIAPQPPPASDGTAA